MTIREDFKIDEFQLIDDDGRYIGTLKDVTFEIVWDDTDEQEWFPMRAKWEHGGKTFWASWNDDSGTPSETWHLFESSWRAGDWSDAAAQEYPFDEYTNDADMGSD